MRRFLIIVLLATGTGLSAAAETEAPSDEAGAQAESSAAEEPKANNDPPESHDVFLPTEEISEDFAVPFPVDI